ncbi:Zinc carboxypeptidase [gamma proteobacterium HIMB55]|nr:Zinc carboxypeptidase [gamma proteobacterium HIMB55]
MLMIRKLMLALATVMFAQGALAGLLMKPTADPDLVYDGQILEGNYAESISNPEVFLDFKAGQRVADPAQISAAITAWQGQSDRLKVIEYARTHEGRPLFAVFISSPANLARLDEIEAQITRLSDARNIGDSEANTIIKALPAVAWMAYSIHGNETSGADAALASIYHLIASTDNEVTSMLDNMIVVIDPMMNPDGRARFAKSLEQYRGTAPNVDDQSLLHTGDWPFGRTNHYFFDLNRDFYLLTQPETQGRVALINTWRPQLIIDGHEMGAQSTFLMGPPRQPLNANIDKDLQKWARVFSEEQGAAFDDRSWRYFTGEWFENWYPGYSNYAEYRGSMHILYEQSRMAEDGVRRPEGTVQTYMESVHHQFVSTMANLKSLATHSQAMYRDYWDGRKYNVSSKSEFGNRSYVFLANENHGRMNALVERLEAQGIELYTNKKPITVAAATTQLGEEAKNVKIPAGSLIVPNRQPDAPLVAAILEFDADVKKSVLVEERQRTLRDGSSLMYDTTAWNFSMMYGLPSITVPQHLAKGLSPWTSHRGNQSIDESALAWAVSGEDDRSVAFAARLMEQGINVRIIDKATVLSDQALPRGTVIVTAMDNPKRDDVVALVSAEAKTLDVDLVSVGSGYGAGDLPDWGGAHFRLLSRPQVAILSQQGFSSYDVGSSWWAIDTHLGIRHSQIDTAYLSRADLRRYNTIVMPNGYRPMSSAETSALRDWIKQGGTLIAHDNSAAQLARDSGIGQVRSIGDALDNAQDYDIALQRERLSTSDALDTTAVSAHRLSSAVDYPWDQGAKALSGDELKRREAWQKRFMPSGAMVAGKVDTLHWMSFGTAETLPLLYENQPVLMTKDRQQAVVRVGVLQEDIDAGEAQTVNWSTVPAGNALTVRMSGLIWPEAAARIANSAYVTRERVGKGQVILFSGQPNFRGSTRGVGRIWLNALVYGAGLGTSPKVTL